MSVQTKVSALDREIATVMEVVAERTIALPFHNNVTRTECEEVVLRLRGALRDVSVRAH